MTLKINNMITQLSGRLLEKNPTEIIIDCAGVGYLVRISLNTYSNIGDDEHLRIYTELIIREDAHSLYGFSDKTERELFRHLISVSGIGPNTAMIMLSSLTPDSIAQAIISEDVRTIQGIKGIGAKTAQRLIIDLRDKMLKMDLSLQNIVGTNNTNRNDALTALVSLGFDRRAADKALDKASSGSDDSVERLIKEALKIL